MIFENKLTNKSVDLLEAIEWELYGLDEALIRWKLT